MQNKGAFVRNICIKTLAKRLASANLVKQLVKSSSFNCLGPTKKTSSRSQHGDICFLDRLNKFYFKLNVS